MKKIALTLSAVVLALPLAAAPYRPDLSKNLGFPIYTNAPSGKQLSGGHAPATTPALAPEESQKAIQLPPGFEARLFASEPEVVNPVAMTWDERGRLWVLELYEYPKGAAKGEKGRDRIKILEDTDGDGKADKVTVFADGFSLATGLALGHGGVYLGAAPNLYFLEDTDGDDKADKTTVLKTGFGMEDRHELLNGFTWGPDGWLYMTHGVFTSSKVRDPQPQERGSPEPQRAGNSGAAAGQETRAPEDEGVVMNAAVARFHPRTKTFEVFADGTSNPWGVDFDRAGNAFVSACVIPHFFHMAPGGVYKRQGGQPANPYAYELLPEIVDFQHYRAAHAGICLYQGDQFPSAWRHHAFIGNIHQSALNLNHLEAAGSSFKATKALNLLGPAQGDFAVGGGNFLVSTDPWFRPVSVQTGPDGALWVMDWYDKYPCYQNAQADPAGVDREHGRIWRVVFTGGTPGARVPSRPSVDMDLKKMASADLVKLLEHPNSWQRRVAQRLLSEWRDASVEAALKRLLAGGKTLEARLAALWTLHGAGLLDDATLDHYAADAEPAIRAWDARLTGERHLRGLDVNNRILTLAADPDPTVRLAVATAVRQYTSGSLTVDTPVPAELADLNPGALLDPLVQASARGEDRLLSFMIWTASEPLVARNPKNALDWLRAHGSDALPLSARLTKNVMRRLCDLTDKPLRAQTMNAVVEFLGDIGDKPELVSAALDGLLEGFKSKGAPPTTTQVGVVLQRFYSLPALADRARRLGVLWGETGATLALVKSVNDPTVPAGKRLEGIQAAREARSDDARSVLLQLVHTEKDQSLVSEGLRALGEIGSAEADTAQAILERWQSYSPVTRRTAADVLVTRGRWQEALLSALESKSVAPGDVSASAVRTLSRAQDGRGLVAQRTAAIFGKVRDASADKAKIIAAKKKIVLTGEPDLKAGYEVAKKTCFVCHKLHGEGADVGPDLTGVGRSTLDALLANVIDPNQIIGAGYENVEVETKDGRTISGRMVENTDNRVRLLATGPKEEIIARSDVALENGKPKIRVSELSVMPEGLEQMSDADFRNLIWFILNPPQDKRALTPALRQELIGDDPKPVKAAEKKSADASDAFRGQGAQPGDGESVALWNPDWKVNCPPFEGAPKKLADFAGRKNVLMTHPADRTRPAALEGSVDLPAGKKASLTFAVAADDRGDWELRVFANDKRLHQQLVDKTGERWKTVSIDLSSYAGQTVKLRLENFPNDWSYEFGYWAGVELKFIEQTARAKP